MTIYCENAAAAEVLFSLTGGREGRIISYNPPVEIERAQGVVAVGSLLSSELRVISVFKTFFAKTIVNGVIGGGTWFSEKNSNSRYYQVALKEFVSGTRQRFRFAEIDRETNIEKVFFDVKYFIKSTQLTSAYPIRAFKNAFIISDTTGVLYAQDYEGRDVDYQVNCISCPSGLTPAKGDENKVACIDVPRVVSGLNNASSKIDSIYG